MRGDAVTLVSMDGSTTDEVPGPADHKLVGTDGSRAILIDDDYKGPLVALDESGTEVWRSSGEYSRARVHNGFILAYETRGEESSGPVRLHRHDALLPADGQGAQLQDELRGSPRPRGREH